MRLAAFALATTACAGEGGPDVNEGALDSLLTAADSAAVLALLDEGVEPLFALVRAARVGSVPMTRLLLERGADPSGALDDGFGSTALMAAASGNHPELVPVLISAGAHPDQPDVFGDPALNWAAYMGHEEVAAALLDHGARADIRSDHGNALDIARRQGWMSLVELFGGSHVEGLEASERRLVEALVAAGGGGAAQVVADALSDGVSPDMATATGIPVLALAASGGDTLAVSLLLAAGALVDAEDPIGFTPLMFAARSGATAAASLLLAAGADVDHQAGVEGMGMRPLHMAASFGHTDVVRLLADAGASLDAGNALGQVAITWALTEGHPETGLALLALGADPDVVGDKGYSARQAAQDYGYASVLEAIRSR